MIHLLLPALLLAEGIAVGIAAYIMFLKKQQKLALYQRTRGDVIEIKESESGKHPVVRFQTTNGEVVIFESPFGNSNGQIKVGDRIDILFNPSHPAEAEIVNLLAQWMIPLALAASAAGSIITAPVLFFVLRNSQGN